MKDRFGKNKTTDANPSTPKQEKAEEKMAEEKVKKERTRKTPKQKLTEALNEAGVKLRGMFGEKSLQYEQASAVIGLCEEYEALGKKILNTLFPAV